MPDHCFIGSCSSSGNIPGVNYFSFGSKKKEWLEILGISGVENMSPRNKLCSRHFDCCDINFPATPSGRATLKKNAVPKYFLRNKRAPENLPPDVTPQNKKVAGSSSSTDSAGLKHTPKKNRRLIKKMHPYCTTTEKASSKLISQQNKIKQLSYKNKIEKQKTKRLRRKVNNLKDIVQDMRRKELLSRDASNE